MGIASLSTCDACNQLTGMRCWRHSTSGVTIYDVVELQNRTNCGLGIHSWLPWLRLDSGSFVTWCIHCGRKEQWDTP